MIVQVFFSNPEEISTSLTEDSLRIRIIMNGYFMSSDSNLPVKYQYSTSAKVPKLITDGKLLSHNFE